MVRGSIQKQAAGLVSCMEKRRSDINEARQKVLNTISANTATVAKHQARAKKCVAEYAAAVKRHATAPDTPPAEAVKQISDCNAALVAICEQQLGQLAASVRAQQKTDAEYAALAARVTKFTETTLSHNRTTNAAIADAVVASGEHSSRESVSRGMLLHVKRYNAAPFRCQELMLAKHK